MFLSNHSNESANLYTRRFRGSAIGCGMRLLDGAFVKRTIS